MSSTKKHDADDAPASSPTAGGGRWSSKRKVSVILELLRGADLESTSRKHRVTAATLTEWRDRFLAGGEAILKSREADVEDEEKRRLKSVVANVSVDNELLRRKSPVWRTAALWHSGSRDHEPHRLAFQ